MSQTEDPTPPQWAHIELLFAELFDLEPNVQAQRLASYPDAEVRAAVERLLARHVALEAGASTDPLAVLQVESASVLLNDGREVADGTPYRLIRLLGRGSMGAVYLAEDRRLGRAVALKRLSVHLAADPTAVRRFREEARLASSVDHPNVASVFDVGETADGGLFIAMTYCAGGTLRQQLHDAGQSVTETVRVGRALAAGLAAVHARGIVHRDLKPENILVHADSTIRIADFGIAKIAGQQYTRTGTTLGTAAYMSPEQTRGMDVDHRADLWSVGVVLYELLAGRRPFHADSSDALVYAIRHDAPPPLRTRRPDVPLALDRLIMRCLEKDAARRPTDAGALLRALDDAVEAPSQHWLPHRGMLALAVAGTTFAGWWVISADGVSWASTAPIAVAVRHVAPSGPLDTGRSMAMLFEEEYGRALAADAQLRVIPQEAMRALRSADVRRVGARLGVASVMEARTELVRDSFRVTLSLRRSEDGHLVWTSAATRPREAWRVVANELAQRSMNAVHDEFGGRADVGVRRSILESAVGTDRQAMEWFMRGRLILQRREFARMAEAAEYFREAIALDSGFTRAYLGLADVYLQSKAGSPRERERLARGIRERALQRDTAHSEARRLVGWHALWYERDWPTAERHLRAAMALDPTNLWAYHAYAAYLGAVGLSDSSLAVTQRAAALDPVSAITASHLGIHLVWRRQYREAISVLERTLAVDSSWRRTRPTLARAYLAVGRTDDAIRLLRHPGDDAVVFDPAGLIAYAQARAGRLAEAQAGIDALERRAAREYVSPASLVVAHLGVGDTARALDWVERVPADSGAMIFLLAEPLFDPLRDAPRFRRVLDQLGLTPYAARARQTLVQGIQGKARSAASP